MFSVSYPFVWLSRIFHCRGFGIQSPTDYWMVRYVINEHWPYYHYDDLGKSSDWLERKLGRLYFRLSNWRQPKVVESDGYHEYFQAGCKDLVFGPSSEMVRLDVNDSDYHKKLLSIYNKVEDNTVLIIEGINRDKRFWQSVKEDDRTSITFDLYYCGIVLFDKKRHKMNYVINF